MSRAVQIDALWNGLTDNSGSLLNAGKVYFYIAGTSTLKDTYTLPDKSGVNTNPVILDGYGRALVFGDGAYDVVVKDSAGNSIFTIDNLIYEVPGDTNIVGGTASGSSGAYSVTPTTAISAYAAGQEVTFIANHANTGAATLAVSGLAAVTIKAGDGSSTLYAADLISGRAYKVVYDTTAGGRWQLLNPSRSVYEKVRASGTNTLYLGGGGATGYVTLQTNDTDRWSAADTGHLFPVADNTYDLGIASTNRVRDIHIRGGVKGINNTWTPTISASGAMTVATTTIIQSDYFRSGQFIEFELVFQTTLAGVASTLVKASHPFAGVAHDVNCAFIACAENVTDGTTYTAPQVRWRYDAADIVFFLTGSTNWTVGTKVHKFHVQGRYRAI